MSYVNANPQTIADAAGNLASIGSTINAANANAAAGTSGVKAPGGDTVSAAISALFAVHAHNYQVAGAHAANYHEQFVRTLREGSASYASAEAANAMPMQAGGGNVGAGGLGGSGGDAHAAAIAGTQGGNAGGGGANGVPANEGGQPGVASNGGGGGGGGGEVVDPVAAGGGAVNAGVPPAWAPAAPTAPVVPGLAPAPGASAVMAGGYPAAAGLLGAGGFSGGSAFGGMGEPEAAAASAAAAPAAPGLGAAQPAIPTAPKAQTVQPGNRAHSGDPAHPTSTQYNIPAVSIPLPRLRLRGLRDKLHLRSGLRDKIEWQKELREAAESKPWGREELLSALGLRPPGCE